MFAGEHQTAKCGRGEWVGLEDKGQTVSKQDVRVEQKVSVTLLASRDANCLGVGSEDETIADSQEGESERRLRRKMAKDESVCK